METKEKEMNEGDTYTIGALITGIIVFVGVWLYAISEWGFLIGIMVGWFPAIIAAYIAGLLWPLIALLALVIVYLILKS